MGEFIFTGYCLSCNCRSANQWEIRYAQVWPWPKSSGWQKYTRMKKPRSTAVTTSPHKPQHQKNNNWQPSFCIKVIARELYSKSLSNKTCGRVIPIPHATAFRLTRLSRLVDYPCLKGGIPCLTSSTPTIGAHVVYSPNRPSPFYTLQHFFSLSEHTAANRWYKARRDKATAMPDRKAWRWWDCIGLSVVSPLQEVRGRGMRDKTRGTACEGWDLIDICSIP